MSVVDEILALKSAGALNYEQWLEKKESGRPKPNMNLQQTTNDRGKDIQRYFRQSMYELCDWICGCSVRNAFFCYPCLLFSNDVIWAKNGVTDIKHLKVKIAKHAASTSHMICSLSYANLGVVNIKQELDGADRITVHDFNKSVSKNRYILNKLIDCVKFCGSFEIPLRGRDESDGSDNPGIFLGLIDFVSELDSTFKEHIEKSEVFKEISKTIRNDILVSMLAIVHTHIIKEIDQANFVAVQVDESTDKTQMIVILRYVLTGILHERFWKIVDPPGATTQQLADAILEELQVLKINEEPEKLIAQSYDGASAMSGNLGGVQTKIKETYPNANFIHSYAHQLNLILQKAASQHKQIKIFFANLHAFSSFFGRSPKRIELLDRVVKVRLPESAPARWDFDTECVQIVHTHKNDLKFCLDEIIDEEHDDNTIDQATGLKKHLEDDIFLFWLNFFHEIMCHVDVLLKQMQMRDVDVTSGKYVKHYIDSFKNNIKQIKSAILESEEPSTSAAKKRKTTAEDPKLRGALEICDIIISEVHHRFAFNDHLVISQLFHAENFEVYTANFPQNILSMAKTTYPSINISKLKSELEVMYCREDFRNSAGALGMLQFFVNMNLSETFSEAVQLLNILCTLPMTTVESERCFSTLERAKAFLRSTMRQSRLSALCMLSVEKTLVKSIPNFNEKVIDYFAELNDGQIDLKYKHV